MKKIFVLSSFIFIMNACCTGGVKANYNAYVGKAKIIAVEKSVYDPGRDGSYRDVFFEFTPNDPNARQKYRFKKHWPDSKLRLFVRHRGNLLAKWLEKKGVVVGKVYDAIRYEKKGTCGGSPVFFDVKIK